jgi:hypothetical protein
VFETKGAHTVEVGAVWKGVATLTGGDLLTPVVADMGYAVIDLAVRYPVHEVRAVLLRAAGTTYPPATMTSTKERA